MKNFRFTQVFLRLYFTVGTLQSVTISADPLSKISPTRGPIKLLKPTGYVMQHQFNIQQLYALPALY